MKELEDIELVKKVKDGDVLAYEILVRRYEPVLYRFLRRWTNETVLIEEVIQDSLFKLYKNIHRVDEKKKFSSYLFTIAKNQLTDQFRRQKKTLPLLDIVPGSNGEYLYEEVERKDIQTRIRLALLNLKEKQRKIIELYFFEGLTYKKMGKMLGVPLNTIKTNIRRAKTSLKKILKNEKK